MLPDRWGANLRGNPEVIDIDQDSLGQCARVVELTKETFAMVKDLEDGSKAVGLFNRGDLAARVTAPWSALGIEGRFLVRDLWRQQDLEPCDKELGATVPRHGTFLVRLSKPPTNQPAARAR